jgi:peptide/nickel transport system permease protein
VTGFLIRRLAIAVFVVFVVTLLVAWAVRLSGDPAVMLTGAGTVTEQDLVNIRHGLGLDRPFSVQYLSFVGGMLTGHMGRSFMVGSSVALLVGHALPLTFVSLTLALMASIPLRIHAAVHRGRWADQAIRIVSLVGLSFPNFWLALMLVLVCLIGGVVVVERVFNWPGMGSLAFDAVASRDYPVLQACVTVLAAMIVVVNLLIDIGYGMIDPRVRNQ